MFFIRYELGPIWDVDRGFDLLIPEATHLVAPGHDSVEFDGEAPLCRNLGIMPHAWAEEHLMTRCLRSRTTGK